MIAYVSGNVVDIKEDYVVIDNQGLGYRVFSPTTHQFKRGDFITMHTYYYVREDAVLLYGFDNPEALAFFLKIITVKGVGPRTGLNMLRTIPFNRIIEAIESSDVTFLRTLPGVGPKMAGQIVLDLKGKLVATKSEEVQSPIYDDILSALLNLGFRRAEFNQIKNELYKQENQEFDSLLSYSLKLLSR